MIAERPLELRATEDQWRHLVGHLFPGDHDEHGAVLLCGQASSPRSDRLLVRDIVLAGDGLDYVPGVRGYRHLRGEFVTQLIRRAKDEKLVYLAVHNHGGTASVGFSRPDLDSHERGYPTLVDLSGQPVGALVLAQDAVAGDMWLPGGARRDLTRAAVIGSRLTTMVPSPVRGDPTMTAMYERQTLIFGAAGQTILSRAKVAIVGAGGVGLLLVQLLARLGVGHVVVIDPDRVDPTNLPRLPEATRLDAMTWLRGPGRGPVLNRLGRRLARPKVDVARRIALRANRNIVLDAIAGDVADDDVARTITDCDFIFLAADTMLARDVVNQLAFQYMIPALQVGSKVVSNRTTGAVLDVFATVRTLATAPGCMRCNGLIDPTKLAEESVGNERQVKNQRYIDDADVAAPSVMTLNAMGAGWAANDFMQFMTGLGRPARDFRILRTKPVNAEAPHVSVQEAAADPTCLTCSRATRSTFARGDTRQLPTRVRAA